MKIALLSPGSWWTHPKYYEPWETVVSLLYEGLVKRGVDVTLFTGNNSKQEGKLAAHFHRKMDFPPRPPLAKRGTEEVCFGMKRKEFLIPWRVQVFILPVCLKRPGNST